MRGKDFYNYIKQAIEYISSAENKFTELKNLETGCIKIGTSVTLTKEFLLPYLEEFHKLYPKINIQIITNISSELIPKLRNGLIDIVILNINETKYDDIEIMKCKKITNCFVYNKNFYDLKNKELSIKELNKYPLILQAKGASTRAFIDKVAKENNVILKPNIELASYTLVVEFAKIGLGIGYVTKEYIDKELKNSDLEIVKLKEKIPCRYIGVALSKNHLPNFSTKKLIEIIKGR